MADGDATLATRWVGTLTGIRVGRLVGVRVGSMVGTIVGILSVFEAERFVRFNLLVGETPEGVTVAKIVTGESCLADSFRTSFVSENPARVPKR